MAITPSDDDIRQRIEQYNHQLLTSEDQYVNELETIMNYIVKPLEKNALRCKIKEIDVKKVFKYLNNMLQFHLTFLSVIREHISVLKDLYKYINFISMYSDYLGHYLQILDIFASWKSMEFRDFINMRLRHKEIKKHIDDRLCSLPWYLYRPFDRIKEYHRFLKDLEKLTKKGQNDYVILHKTIMRIRPLYKKIKLHENKFQQKTRLLEVQLQIHGNPKPIVDDERFFVYNRMCQMKRRGLPGKKYKRITIYLFNDLFLWVSARNRFKGSYSFYTKELEIKIPINSKAGDAIFSIGLKKEKHKRLIICADDIQRNKLMNTIIRTYAQCQDKLQRITNGNRINPNDIKTKTIMKNIKKKQQHETTLHIDTDISISSIDTRTMGIEESISVSGGTDYTDNTNSNNNHHNAQQVTNLMIAAMTNNINNNNNSNSNSNLQQIPEPKTVDKYDMGRHDHDWNRRDTNHLKATAHVDPNNTGASYNNNSNPIQSVTIPLNPNNPGNITPPVHISKIPDNITPEPSISQISQPSSKNSNDGDNDYNIIINTNTNTNSHSTHSNGNNYNNNNNGYTKKNQKKKHITKIEKIKQLKQRLNFFQQQLKLKSDRIKDLEFSNKSIRTTVILKDNKIHTLQEEIQHLKSQNYRAKSMSYTYHSRIKRAASFSIGPGGHITRTAMLPSQINSKIIKNRINKNNNNNNNNLKYK